MLRWFALNRPGGASAKERMKATGFHRQAGKTFAKSSSAFR